MSVFHIKINQIREDQSRRFCLHIVKRLLHAIGISGRMHGIADTTAVEDITDLTDSAYPHTRICQMHQRIVFRWF